MLSTYMLSFGDLIRYVLVNAFAVYCLSMVATAHSFSMYIELYN